MDHLLGLSTNLRSAKCLALTLEVLTLEDQDTELASDRGQRKSFPRAFYGKGKMISCLRISSSHSLSFNDQEMGLYQDETKVDILFLVAATNGAFLRVIHCALFPHFSGQASKVSGVITQASW